MPLEEYQRKRRFNETPEPAGSAAAPAEGRSFVVQMHDATRLHYDFRIEADGVLISWAVPKGPSLNPKDKRLAVQTEDHPLDYAAFEGIIPAGNYGAGTVIVWDNGTYELEGNGSAREQMAKGDLKLRLSGRKLRGSFALVHTGKRARDPKETKNWLMIKHRDQFADESWDITQLEASVLTGRTLKEVEQGKAAAAGDSSALPGAVRAPIPAEVEPNLASLADKPFSHPDWLFELKWDGMRLLPRIHNGKCELRARSGRTVTAQFPELAVLPQQLSAREAILDGEAVVLDAAGHPDFGLMQQRMSTAQPPASLVREAPVVLYLFDLIYCDGYDLRNVPLLERKRYLKSLLTLEHPVRFSDHVIAEGEQLFELVRTQGLEGIVAKQSQSRYCPGRNTNWLKLKVTREVDAVVGGYTEPRGSREHFGALLLGLYENGGLRFVGSVGSGFNERTLPEVMARLKALETKKMPFRAKPQTREAQTYVEPVLVARVKYNDWTHDGHLRAPVFVGLRDDLEAQDATLAQVEVRKPQTPPAAAKTADEPQPGSIEEAIRTAKGETLQPEVAGKRLRFSNLNKIYFPGPGLRKRDLLEYYAWVSPLILPFLENRPLVLRRMPDGVTGQLFYQKEAGKDAPAWAETAVIPSDEKDIRYFVGGDPALLLYLVNLGCIDHNPWSSRVDALEMPDWVFIDLDPTDGTEFSTVVEVAKAAHGVLSETGLKSYIKTSGSTGIHIFVPLERVYQYEQVSMFTELVARLAGSRVPELVTWERTVAKRLAGRVLIDYSQLAYSRPLACVYSVRPAAEASVSAPVAPEELLASLRPEQFTVKTMRSRIAERGDLWGDFWQSRQRLEPALERLQQILAGPAPAKSAPPAAQAQPGRRSRGRKATGSNAKPE